MVPSAGAWRYLQQAHFTPSLPAGDGTAERAFCPWWPWLFTMTFKLIQARDQTHITCKFGANPFSSSRDIWCTSQKKWKSQTALKTEPYLHVVTTGLWPLYRSTCVSRHWTGGFRWSKVLLLICLSWEANSKFWLGKRCWSSQQWFYLWRLHTVSGL